MSTPKRAIDILLSEGPIAFANKSYDYLKSRKFGAKKAEKAIYTNFGRYEYNKNGINIFSEDWDNLIILDATRYDTFNNRREQYGTLERKISRGGASPEWVRANFNQNLHDVVYVTSNGWYYKMKDSLDGELCALDFVRCPKEPDRRIDTQRRHIELVSEYAKEAIQKYPNKRLLVHYPSPHTPFIGETANEYFSSLDAGEYKPQNVTRDLVRQAYNESFDIVFEEAKSVVNKMKGKTVISSDHGEMIGERHRHTKVRDYAVAF